MNTYSKTIANQVAAVGRTLGVLKFAVGEKVPFQISDVAKIVNDVNNTTDLRYVKVLIQLGYIEKTTCCKYQATQAAHELIISKQNEVKTKYNWTLIPEHVVFMATDEDGTACGWLVEPKISGDAWRHQSHLSAYFYINRRNNRLNHFQGDWQESLEKRPEEQSR